MTIDQQITEAIAAATRFVDAHNPTVKKLLARFHELKGGPDTAELIEVCQQLVDLDGQFQTLANNVDRLITQAEKGNP